MKIRGFIKRHALPTYFVLAFGIAWGGSLVIAGPQAILTVTSPSSIGATGR